MLKVLKAQGLDSINSTPNKKVAVTQPWGAFKDLAIRNWWTSPGQLSPFEIKTAKSLDAGVDGTAPEVAANSDAFDIVGAPGQGNSANPPALFQNHWIVVLNNNASGATYYYDPSYAIGPFFTRKEYEAAAFAGITQTPNGGGVFLHVWLPPPGGSFYSDFTTVDP